MFKGNRSNFVFCQFWQKSENSKWPPFLKNIPKVGVAYCLNTLGVKNFDEIAISLTVKEIEATLCSAIFENFSKSGCSILLRYSGGRKF